LYPEPRLRELSDAVNYDGKASLDPELRVQELSDAVF